MEYTFYNEQTNTEHEWSIEYRYSEFIPGYIFGEPENCYPDEGAEIEDLQVTDENGKDINEIDALTLLDIQKKCMQEVESFIPDFD